MAAVLLRRAIECSAMLIAVALATEIASNSDRELNGARIGFLSRAPALSALAVVSASYAWTRKVVPYVIRNAAVVIRSSGVERSNVWASARQAKATIASAHPSGIPMFILGPMRSALGEARLDARERREHHVSNRLQASRAHGVERVVGRVPGFVVEID